MPPITDNNTSELITPVLLELGKTLLICQGFESSLCFLLSLMSHESSEGEDGAFQASWDFHSKKTMGNLLALLGKNIDVPKDLNAFLDEGVKKRNEVVHGFLTRNAERLADPNDRIKIEQELVTLKHEIKRRDVAVNKLLDTLLKNYGTSNEQLKRNADRLWEYLNPETSSVGGIEHE